MSPDTFVREAGSNLQQLTDGLVELEETRDPETVDELFRIAHSLKSAFSMEGHDRASELAHAIEDVLEGIRAGRLKPDQRVVDESLSAADTLKTMLDEIDRREQTRTDPTPHIDALREVVEDAPGDGATDSAVSVPSADQPAEEESAEPMEDAEVRDALDAASEFDDLDALIKDMDEPEDAPTLEGAGTFEEILGDDESAPGEPDSADTGADQPAGDEVPDNEFIWIKSEVEAQEEPSLSELQSEIEAESFGEFDDDDDMTIQELVALGEDDRLEEDTQTKTETGTTEPVGRDEPTSATAETAETTETTAGPNEQEALKQVFDVLSSETGETAGSDAPVGGESGIPARPDVLDAPSERSGTDDPDIGTFGAGTESKDLESRFNSPSESEETTTATAEVAATIEDSALPAERFRARSTERTSADVADTVRSLTVDIEYADELLSLVERLSIETQRLTDEAGSEVERETLDSVKSTVQELQRTVMEIRLVPVEAVTSNLQRVARDSARSTETQVSLNVEGAGTRVDRSIIDRLGDPLVHLVRNAVDHGIEPSAKREATGKEPTGTVEVEVRRTGDHVVVEVSDDGRGIDPDAVREEAIEAGLLSRSEAVALPDEDIYELIFHPGISTSDTVTDTSGRGVGMDVVREAVTAMNGQFSVDSTPGEGTTVRLRLPVTMAVSELVILTVDGEEFAVSASNVDHVGPDGGGRVTQSLPTAGTDRRVDLGETLGLNPVAADQPTVVTVDTGDDQLGIECDSVVDRRTGIVTPYDSLLAGIPELSGATTGTDEQLIHVIDITRL